MPDVLTHLLVGVSIAFIIRRDDNKSEQMLIVLGALLIDIERPFSWILQGTALEWIGLGTAFHSILGTVVLSYFGAACFVLDSTNLQNRTILIFIGCVSHLIMDLVMYPWVEVGLYILYPLKIPFSFNLLWPDFWWYPLYGVTILMLSIGFRFLSHHLKRNQ